MASFPAGQRLPHLDGLRGIAAISVVLYHVHNLFGLTLGFERSYLFVDVFFILSGFVLSRAWAKDFAHDVDGRILFKARIRRLWPTMALASLLGAAIHFLLNDVQNVLSLLVVALLLIPLIGQSGPLYPLNGPQWSIFWELFANLVHVRWLRGVGPRQIFAIALVAGLFTLAAILLCGANTSGPNGDLWWLAGARVGWSYAMGMLIASAQQRTDWRPLLSWWQALALFLAAVLILPLLAISTAAGDILFTMIVSPLLFWLLVTSRAPVAASRWLSKLGALSFPLYAIHLPLLTLCTTLVMPKSAAAALAVISSVCLSACFSGSNSRGRGGSRANATRAPLKLPA